MGPNIEYPSNNSSASAGFLNIRSQTLRVSTSIFYHTISENYMKIMNLANIKWILHEKCALKRTRSYTFKKLWVLS